MDFKVSAGEALEVLNPTTAKFGGAGFPLATRPAKLDNLTIGLVWNGKAMGDVALKTAGELLTQKFKGVTTRFYSGTIPCAPTLLAQVAAECDVVVACTADCGGCTSWTAHDCIQLERKGIPTVIIASAGYEDVLEASARAFSLPNVPYVVVPKVFNNLEADQAAAQVKPVFDEIIARLLPDDEDNSVPSAEVKDESPATFVFHASGEESALESFNQDFMQKDWGDGYPLWAPTQARVDAILAAIDGSPDDVVCYLPPGNGEATVGKIAANAAMAGCKPGEVLVVMAALRAIAKMGPMTRQSLMSTSAHAPLVVVNGPLARELGINGGRSCVGPGKQNEVNIRISRAIVFCLKNLGAWYPGIMDMDTIGTTRKNIVVVAENEEESPWEPYHVSQGFLPDDNTATVFFTNGEWDIAIQGHESPQQLAEAIASFSGGNNHGGYFSNVRGIEADASTLGRLLFLAPPHAIPLKEGGFSKKALANYMFQQAQEPISRLIAPIRRLHASGKVKPEWEWLFHLSDTEARRQTLPVLERAETYRIVVVGSIRAKDLLMPTRCIPWTEKITRTPT
jgi:hypothetical protein